MTLHLIRDRQPTPDDPTPDDPAPEENREAAPGSDERDETADWTRTAALLSPGPGKRQISLRLDNDVLAFFKRGGRGYQSRINAVLRAYMLSREGEGG